MEPAVFSRTLDVLDGVVKMIVMFTDLSFYVNYMNILDSLGA